ncbi:hypothetical protein BB560_002228 [Smittium megazygosporum]|uniref:Uncharacterized protein n=1 Tax=Smittium megazygosporum TaxID=133381 RepID=A0A2T9ZFE8_9FUNG|nr:hypothetical protein BB560_002228 [Smittium megazygosporum]
MTYITPDQYEKMQYIQNISNWLTDRYIQLESAEPLKIEKELVVHERELPQRCRVVVLPVMGIDIIHDFSRITIFTDDTHKTNPSITARRDAKGMEGGCVSTGH